MYFVVYILQTKEYVVVPHAWINGLNSYIEKFMNDGVRSRRKFFVFWTHKLEAFITEGIPLKNYPPNMNASFASNFPHEGWYDCHITRFKSKRSILGNWLK